MSNVEPALRQEAHALRRVRGPVLGEFEHVGLSVHVLVIAHVAVAFASEVEHVRVLHEAEQSKRRGTCCKLSAQRIYQQNLHTALD